MNVQIRESEHADIRRLSLFSDMEDKNFNALMQAVYVQNFPPQVELISEGDSPDFLQVLLSGGVELFASWENQTTTMAVVRPVSTFILAASIKDQPYLMSARSIEKSRIALIPSKDVRAIFDEDIAFARAIVTELAQCYRNVVKHTKDLKLRTSLERLANYILRNQAKAGGPDAFELPIEKRRLASLLGMTPENLSRAFKALGPHGVRVNGNSVHIENAEKLVVFAKPNRLIDDYSS